jgi:hypothetical protein
MKNIPPVALLALALLQAACGGPISQALGEAIWDGMGWDVLSTASEPRAARLDDPEATADGVAAVAPQLVELGPGDPEAARVVEALAARGHDYRVVAQRRAGDRALQTLLARAEDGLEAEAAEQGRFTFQGPGDEQGWVRADVRGRPVIFAAPCASGAERQAQLEELATLLGDAGDSAVLVGLGDDLGPAGTSLRALGFAPLAGPGRAWARGPQRPPALLEAPQAAAQVLRFPR